MIKRIFSMLLTMMLVFSLPWGTAHAAGQERETPRVIHVVYDDSTSMYRYYFTDGSVEYYDKWCRARYSLEVFSALMGENDVMNIYPVNWRGKALLTLKGSDSPQSRIDQIHRMTDRTGGTPYETVEKAAAAFTDVGEDVEKWLVVLTDGDFTTSDSNQTVINKPLSEINADLSDYAADGINVAYLAIGEDIRYLPDQKTADGIYVWKAATSTEILQSVTAISNTIFERQQLPDSRVTLKNDTLTISTDVPMEQLVIFAQGDDVSLSGEAESLEKLQSAAVRYSDSIPEGLLDEKANIPVARGLSGLLADFRSADENPIPAGEYTFSVSGMQSVQIYYKPSVFLGVALTQDGEPLDGDPVEGEIQVELFLQDPVTGERLRSNILSDVEFTGTLTQNGVPYDWTGSRTTLTLQDGSAQLELRAELPGYNYVEESLSLDVQSALGGLVIKAQPRTDISAADLPVTDAVTYTFFRVDPDTGAEIPLTEAELATLTFTVERVDDGEKEILIRHELTDAGAALSLDHAQNDGGRPDPLSTFTGTLRVRAFGTFESDGQKGSGEVFTDITVQQAGFLTRLGWIWNKWWWLIVAVLLLLMAFLYYYLAYVRTAKFLRGRKGLSSAPQMVITTNPGTSRAKSVPDPVQTCSIQLARDYQRRAFCAQRANVVIGCRGQEHFRFQVEAAVFNGQNRMRALNLLEQLSGSIYSDVTVDGIELVRISPDYLFGYHMQIHYRKISGRKKEDFDVRL